MAYLKLGLTQSELASSYKNDVIAGVAPTDLLARYGKRPGRFLNPQTLPGYSDLNAPEFDDHSERQYSRVDISDRRRLYVRLPMGLTRRQNATHQLFHDVQDFPKPGDRIKIRGYRKAHKNPLADEGVEYAITHVMRIPGHVATAMVELDRDLPEREDVEPDEKFEQKMQRRIEAQKRKFHIQEGEVELSQETQRIVAGHPRPRLAPQRPHGPPRITAMAAPRAASASSAPKAKKAK